MFKRIQKIERKKRLIFLIILSSILSVTLFFSAKETIYSLPFQDFMSIGFFVFFLNQIFDLSDDLMDEIKKEHLKKHIISKPD